MSNSRIKFAIVALVATAVVLGGSLYLFAREPLPAAPFSPPPPSTSSTQAKITWSTTSIEVILSPGESTANDLTFSSSLGLTNVTIEAVPEIAGYLAIAPASVTNLRAGQSQPLHIAFSIPASATLGTYSGTVHVRDSSQTYPQTLKVTVNVWRTLSDSDLGLSLHYPAGWTAIKSDSGYTFSSVSVPATAELATGEEIELIVESNAEGASIDQWLLSHYQVNTSAVPAASIVQGSLKSGEKFIQLRGVAPSENSDNAQTFFSSGKNMFVLRISPTTFQAEYNNVLKTVSLS